MTTPAARCLAVVLFVLLLVAGCRGSSDDLTDRDITDGELAAMMPAQEEFGEELAAFDYDQSESGFVALAEPRQDTPAGAELVDGAREFGGLQAYKASYISSGGSLPSQPVGSATIHVVLYETAEGAASHVRNEIEEREQDDRDRPALETTPFKLTDVGDDARGLETAIKGGLEELGFDLASAQAFLAFHRGRIAVWAEVFAIGDDWGARRAAEDIARKADARIVGVLEGSIEASGTPTPEPTATLGPPPTATPFIAPANAPTEVLRSFRFEFSLEIESEGREVFIHSDGEYQAPASSVCHLEASYELRGISRELSIVITGDDVLLDDVLDIDPSTRDDPIVQRNVPFCPSQPAFWAATSLSEFADVVGASDTKNGVAGSRYSLHTTEHRLSRLLPADIPASTFDVWLADDGGWVVSLEAEVTGEAQRILSTAFPEASASIGEDEQATIRIRLDLSDPNDPAINIPPVDY